MPRAFNSFLTMEQEIKTIVLSSLSLCHILTVTVLTISTLPQELDNSYRGFVVLLLKFSYKPHKT